IFELLTFNNANSSKTFFLCLNVAPNVLFFSLKHVLVKAHHSSKFTSGVIAFGRIITTDESTFGQGRKSLLLTSIINSTSATNFTFTANLLISESPGLASNRLANSF
ncbi:hypothetical protein CFOL_v3_02747, partial [Cephalotus follicularis]